jgi:succinate dehydrogenase/fumarate reductase flavoprotein subunit
MKQVSCDVLVAGSGAGGLSCAFAAREMGMRVILTEKAPHVGGTTAWSGGEIWVPCSKWQLEAGIHDTVEAAVQYLEAASEGHSDAERIRTYVETAAEAVDFFVARGAMEVEVMADAPDYFDQLPGAHQGGRTLRTVPFDGRALGSDFRTLRDPLLAAQIFGGLSVAREDIAHFQAALRSPRSAFHIARLLAAHGRQRIGGLHRGSRTTMGNAMVARLFAALRRRAVPIWVSSPVTKLLLHNGAVSGATVETPDGAVEVVAKLGVVLATGGFSHDLEMVKAHFPHVRRGQDHASLPPPQVAGDGLSLAAGAGGRVRGTSTDAAAWTAVSVRQNDGRTLNVPHFGDRAKPGIIAVLPSGRRFANEATNYHDFCKQLISSCAQSAEAFAWLICDHRALRRYGLGRVGPFPAPLGSHLKCGYLIRGGSMGDLAERIGVDSQALAQTVETYNAMARTGIDEEFQKGNSSFDRAAGDATYQPNPCMAPLTQGPFYAIRIVPGSLSTFLGLDTDKRGAVLDGNGRPIPGLYAIGADAESVAGGSYPAAGITLGPAVTFAFIAARSMSEADPCEIDDPSGVDSNVDPVDTNYARSA